VVVIPKKERYEMIAFKKLFNVNSKGFISFILAAIFCVIFILPAKVEAGWLEDQITNIQSKLNSLTSNMTTVRSRVTNVYSKVVNAANKITDENVSNLILDMQVMLKTAVDTQQEGVTEFMDGGNCTVGDGTPCGDFRADLINLVHIARGLNNQILALHNIEGLNLQIQDLGLADLIEQLPGRVLLPLYKVVTKTQFLTPELINAMENAGDDIFNLKTVLFIEGAPEVPTALEACQFVDTNSKVFKISANSIKGFGLVLKVLGKLFEALGKTPAGGPNEVDAGIHGYVHATIKTNTLGTIGKILGGISEPMSSASSFVSNKVSSCGDMVRDFQLQNRQVQIITNQGQIISKIDGIVPNSEVKENQLLIIQNQETILRGQRETLCAYKNNLPEQCAEFTGNGYDNRGMGK
jgi:hypothetical protein